jgi:hypothetical protein
MLTTSPRHIYTYNHASAWHWRRKLVPVLVHASALVFLRWGGDPEAAPACKQTKHAAGSRQPVARVHARTRTLTHSRREAESQTRIGGRDDKDRMDPCVRAPRAPRQISRVGERPRPGRETKRSTRAAARKEDVAFFNCIGRSPVRASVRAWLLRSEFLGRARALHAAGSAS